MTDYHINVFYSAEDECYVADIPELRFCSAFGASPEEAVREVQIAKSAWLRASQFPSHGNDRRSIKSAVETTNLSLGQNEPRDLANETTGR
jgi:predicted RNase H-like HicB family nuclease